MIKNIKINHFRLFKDMDFNIGKRITVIAGKNAVGKSNLLGMIGNSVELKKYKPLIHNKYRTEFADIFKGSLKHDPSSSNKYIINFTDDKFERITDHREFRVSWQDNKTRFRIIPKKKLKNGKKTEAKAEWPTLYLGLSRLYPLGESKKDIVPRDLNLDESEKEWFLNKYKHILSMSNEKIDEISRIDMTDNTKSIGINTENYDYLANSAGQDNIGQILITLLSFKRLKNEDEYDYHGGLLLIDEIDATLHPLAQRNLFDVFYKFSKDNDVQIVFTTHSMSLLKYITGKTYYNKNNSEFNNDIELLYLTNDNDFLEVEKNPTYNFIENELLLQSAIHRKGQIKFYVEDYEAEWFLKNLISNYSSKVDIKVSKLGYQELLHLNKIDMEYFSSVIIILDGDVKDKEIEKSFENEKIFKNIIKLPGNNNPEMVFYNYLCELPGEHEFFSKVKTLNITKKYIREKGPDSYSGDLKDREKSKKWFNDHINYFDEFSLYDYWANDNEDLVNSFISDFKEKFNHLAKILRLPRI